MIEKLTVESFKSIQSVTLELGQVNVFIGANGSGKSNLLEALAVLSAAASGKVDQSTLVWRGCRASSYYRPMFEGCSDEAETRLVASGVPTFGDTVSYDVTLKAPPAHRLLPWEFQAEKWQYENTTLLDRQPESNGHKTDPQAGLAALRLAETSPNYPGSLFLKSLAAYSIYSPDTPVLHGWVKDPQEREPVGLGGGRLAEALEETVRSNATVDALNKDFSACVDWFESFAVAVQIGSVVDGKHRPDFKPSNHELAFRDRYFRKEKDGWSYLNPNDVNEGALYLTFLAVLGLHPQAPRLFAVENVDHGLNPLLAKRLITTLSERILSAPTKRQAFLTTHNPLVLDGLPLGDDRVRLFTVDRDNKGHSVVKRFVVTEKHREMAEKGWTLSRMWINKLIGGVPDV